MKSTIRIAAVLALATCLGAGWARVKAVPWTVNPAVVAERIAKAEQGEQRRKTEIDESIFIDLDGFIELMDQGAAVIDARDRAAFEQSHLAVGYEPPVLNIFPEDDLTPHLDRLYQLAGLPIVLYCNSTTCYLAEDLYLMLVDAGVAANSPISIFKPGWDVLEKTDLPKTAGPDRWTGFGSMGGEMVDVYADDEADGGG